MTEQERLLRDTRLFVLDMDGTFYLGDRLLPGAADFLQAVTAAGKKYLFFTNNSSRAPEDYVRRLAGMGCPITREQIMTICNICGAKVADISPTSMTMELSDTPERVRTFEDMMRPYNILEVARTGVIALQKGGGKI